MKSWIITIASILIICLLLGALCYAEFGSFNFIRIGLALTKTMGTDEVFQIADSPERVWLVGTRGGLDAFRAYLEADGWQLRMDEQLGALIPAEKDGLRDYVHWSVNGMYHQFTWETRGETAREPGPTEPAAVYHSEAVTCALYLYPEADTRVTVRPAGTVTFAYPACDGPWQLDAHPDGTFDMGLEHHRLQWEAASEGSFALEEGFCVAGTDTAAFLEDALARLGLNRREAGDFLLHWLPQMEGNAWNLISFRDHSGADISPAPDTHIRVCMLWMPLEEPVEIAPQILTAPDRTGFTVVEWAGGLIE